jgi:UDP-2-acetamido-3-amino-2,3-dideoxy-glucuronate N-acetyltransferase
MVLPKVAVIGCGYWGKNLVRVMHELGALALACDVNENLLAKIKADYGVRTTGDWSTAIRDPEIEAVVIAVPAAQHYELTKFALENGKDAFVEKPLALRVNEARELVSLAAERARILMVGHILEYHPAIVELKGLVDRGELGKLLYIYSSRLNLGKLRTEENILWSFAPHDISAILSILNEMPERVSAQGGYYLHPDIADTTLTTCAFRSGVKAHIFVSWLHPFKEQKLAVVGDRKMAVFDDMESERKLVLYSHRIDWQNRAPVAQKDGGQVVPLPGFEPLRVECEHFLQCLSVRCAPRTDGASALRVLQVLEDCEQSLRQGGASVGVVSKSNDVFCHPTAVIDQPCEIGSGTKIWHFAHVMAGSKIGTRCVIGQNVLVGSGVTMGNNVKVQNNVSVYTGVELEDDVFCGPSMVFTNVINPRSHIVRKHEFRPTVVKRGASLGANCTILCGHTIGRYAFIGAGAVVTSDVPDYALVLGVPGRIAGWMCYCGTRLPESGASRRCPACGRRYTVNDGECKEIKGSAAVTVEAAATS